MTKNKPTQFSNALPIPHLVIFSVCSFGTYQLYWFYKNWAALKKHKNLDIKPGWRVVGLMVPIYNAILIYEQFKDIKKYAKEINIPTTYSPGLLLLAYVILSLFIDFHSTDQAILILISLLTVLPLITVQKTLNQYWQKEQEDLPVKEKLSFIQIILSVFGAALIALFIVAAVST